MKNDFNISDDGKYYIIHFRNGGSFLVDASDFPLVSEHTWFKGKRGYPVMKTSRKSAGGMKTITLHRFLLKPNDGFDVDHISGNKMDNRRSNLRICTHQQNMFNQKIRNTNTSGYYGVSCMKSCGRYEAYIHHNGKKIYLGLYATAEEAAKVRDKEALRLFGKYAQLNFEDTAQAVVA